VLGDQRWTYARCRRSSRAAARGLETLGIGQGDRVAVMMPNHPAVPIGSSARCRSVLRSQHQFLIPAGQIEHMLSDSGARILLTARRPRYDCQGDAIPRKGIAGSHRAASLGAGELAPIVAHFASDLGKSVLPLQALLNNDGRYVRPSLNPTETLAVLQYTGGTTGAPKGAMRRTRTLRQCAPNTDVVSVSCRRIGTPVDPLPFSHITGSRSV